MTNIILKTEWEHWDKYLSKFVGQKINCLDIGAYTGEATCWMLNNLCGNPYSKVFSIDTWETTTEYDNYTNEVEKIFDQAIEKTGKENHHVKMKMPYNTALHNLKEGKFIIFDLIFINATHVKTDILTSAILSWDILNEEGILIFDDYKKLESKDKNVNKNNIAIDSFVSVFENQLKTLYKETQYIIEKINKRDNNNPELEYYYNLLDKINYYKYEKYETIIEDEINEELEFKLDTIKNKFENDINDIYKLQKQLFYKNEKIIPENFFKKRSFFIYIYI